MIDRLFVRTEICDSNLYDCEQILVDSGVNEEEAAGIMQAIGYALLDQDLYPGLC